MMSTVPIVIKWISADPWVIGLGRLVIASISLYLLSSKVRQISQLKLKDWGILACLGLCFGLHWVTYFFSIKLGLATVAVISTVSFYGIFLSIVGSIFLGYKIQWFHGVAFFMAVLGAVLVSGDFDMNSNALVGFLFGILSGGFYGILPILHQKSTHLNHDLRSWGQFTGALPIFILCAPLGHWDIPVIDGVGILYLGLIGTVGAHTLWVHASSTLPTTASSLLMYLYIPLSAIMGYFILGESLTLIQTFGALLIMFGSIFGMLGDKLIKMVSKKVFK